MTISATLEDIATFFSPQHATNGDRVAEIVAACTADDGSVAWDMPPVVVVENEGNGATILDGHHRCEAAKQLGLASIPAWVVSVSDYCKLVDIHFDGNSPNRIYDLREHIMCGDVTANELCDHGT